MPQIPEPTANPETPWEFLDEDQRDVVPNVSAEEAAMHVVDALSESALSESTLSEADPAVVVHYREDEHPEVPDRSIPVDSEEKATDVEDLLIRQHYLPADED